MKFKNKHQGSSLEDFLNEESVLEEATIYAIKSVIAGQLGEEMKNRKITKIRMAGLMQTNLAQLNHVLDPQSKNTHLETRQSAARVVGRKLKIELV